MLHSVEGVFKDGKIELAEVPQDVKEAKVIVTFLPEPPQFTQEELDELRFKFAAWENDWNYPGMEVYDDYEARRRGPGVVPPQ